MSENNAAFGIQRGKVEVHRGDYPGCGKQYRKVYRLSDDEVRRTIEQPESNGRGRAYWERIFLGKVLVYKAMGGAGVH